MEEKTKKLKQGKNAAFIASLANLGLAVMKGIVGTLFGSPLLVADAFHSSADLLAHAASGFGLWIASRGKSKRFPYGLYRAETLACLIVGCLIALAGFEIFKEGLEKLQHLESVESFPLLPMAASIISSITAFFVARMEAKAGKAIGSQSLIANAREAVLDIYTSLIVLAGIFLAYYEIPYVEGSIIIMIAILIFKLGIENIWNSLLILLDANPDIDMQSKIEEMVNRIYGVKGISNVKIRKSGPFNMVECVISTRPSLSLYKAHELADRVEDCIMKKYEHIESVIVHMEPMTGETRVAAVPVKNTDGINSIVHEHFARAPYFLILELNDNHHEIIESQKNGFLEQKQHMGVKAARVIIQDRIDILFAHNVGEISYHMLRDNLVDIYEVNDGARVSDIIKDYRLNRLSPMTGPTRLVESAVVSG